MLEEEGIGMQIAILLHDIGHGPFSHAMGNKLSQVEGFVRQIIVGGNIYAGFTRFASSEGLCKRT